MNGAVLVSILKPDGCKTFGDYTANVFVPHIEREENQSQRVDIVWDQYFDNSLKHKPQKSIVQDQLNEDMWSCPVPYQGTGNSFFAWTTTRESCLNSLTVNL